MIVTSTLANFFSNLINHYKAKKSKLRLKKTKNILKILDIFIKEGLIIGFILEDNLYINIILKYHNNKPVLNNITLISKPGKRVYINNKWLYKNNKLGIFILSTPKGFLTDVEAKKFNLGGELICRIN